MDEKTLRASLRDLPLGELRYFPKVSSTNDEALAWAAQGAGDLSLVVANEQTSGRGRQGRKWFSPPDSALAFSLLMRPTPEEAPFLTRLTGLAGLAVAAALQSHGIPAQIKWPNDILAAGDKLAGILVESVWSGDVVDCAVIGIGLNVAAASVPPREMLSLPAASLEDILGEGAVPPRELVLRDILQNFITMRPLLVKDELIHQWEALLAWHGQAVEITEDSAPARRGILAGLAPDGSLLLDDEHGNRVTILFGDVRLRPAGA